MCDKETKEEFKKLHDSLEDLRVNLAIVGSKPILTPWQQITVLTMVASICISGGGLLYKVSAVSTSVASIAADLKEHIGIDNTEHKDMQHRVTILEVSPRD